MEKYMNMAFKYRYKYRQPAHKIIYMNENYKISQVEILIN